MVKRIERFQDAYEGTLTYELDDGRYVTLDQRTIAKYGLKEVLASIGVTVSDKRSNVIQRGRVVGSLPGDFEPAAIRSTSFFYDPRPGDFSRRGEVWVAADTLCPGDFEAIPGFVWGLGEAGE